MKFGAGLRFGRLECGTNICHQLAVVEHSDDGMGFGAKLGFRRRIEGQTGVFMSFLRVRNLHENGYAVVRKYLEAYWPCDGGLSAVNAIGTQLRDLINSGLA